MSNVYYKTVDLMNEFLPADQRIVNECNSLRVNISRATSAAKQRRLSQRCDGLQKCHDVLCSYVSRFDSLKNAMDAALADIECRIVLDSRRGYREGLFAGLAEIKSEIARTSRR